jgi:protein TonB
MKKTLSIITLAGITTFGLFAFMAFLINSDQVVITKGLPPVIIDIVEVPDENKPEIIVRKQLQPPEPPPAMETDRLPPETTEVSSKFDYTQSDMSIESVNTDTVMTIGPSDQDARPVVRVNPKYPMSALRNGIQGWVKLAFDISEIGEVINVKVLDSKPKRVFDKAAKQALRKWKYRAKSVDGKQVQQQNFTVQLDFNMEQQI